MSQISYSFKLKVLKEHLDNLHHVNNVTYLNWVQIAAEKHWSQLTDSKFDTEYVWVVLRHEIDYLGAALLDDELIIKTWIGESLGVKSIRYVSIYNNEKLLVRAKTTWCLLTKNSMKPVRIPPNILDILK